MEKLQKYFRMGGRLLAVIALILFTSMAQAQLADSHCPMLAHDAQHSCRSTFARPDSVELNWVFSINAENGHPPVIGKDSTIYLCAEKLYALRLNGIIKWESKVPESGELYTCPTIDPNGNIIIGGDYQNWYSGSGIYSFTSDGYVNWLLQISPSDGILSPTISNDGTIYVGSSNDTLYAINANGIIKWKYGVKADIFSVPAVGKDGTCYFLCRDGYIYAIRSNGTFKWKYQVASGYLNIAVYYPSISIGDDGTIYFSAHTQYGSFTTGLCAINPDGTTKWSFDRSHWGWPAIGLDGTIYVPNLFNIVAISAEGTKKWEYDIFGNNK